MAIEFAEVVAATRETFRRGPWGRKGRVLEPLNPPARPEHIAAAGLALGVDMPADLTQLLLTADGGYLLVGSGLYFAPVDPDSEPDRPANAPDGPPIVHVTEAAREMTQVGGTFHGRAEYQPQQDFLALTGFGQFGLWYEASGPHAGSILYYHVLASHGVIKAAPSLENLFLANLEVMRSTGNRLTYNDTVAHIYDQYEIDPRIFR